MDVNTGAIGVLWALWYKGWETNSDALQEQYILFTTEDFPYGLCILEYEKYIVVFCLFYDIIVCFMILSCLNKEPQGLDEFTTLELILDILISISLHLKTKKSDQGHFR